MGLRDTAENEAPFFKGKDIFMTEKRKFSAPMTLSDEIADIVRDRILRGEYRIGEERHSSSWKARVSSITSLTEAALPRDLHIRT